VKALFIFTCPLKAILGKQVQNLTEQSLAG